MEFVQKTAEWRIAEFTLDPSVYSKDAVMKTAYLFLDRAYFTFRNAEGGFQVKCKTKSEKENAEDVLGDFANELLNTLLRESIAAENRTIRETIFSWALAHCFREPEDLSCRPRSPAEALDKDLDQILKEIEDELGLDDAKKDQTT